MHKTVYLTLVILGNCPTVFDGWSCVNSTPSGTAAVFPCPKFSHLNFYHESKIIIFGQRLWLSWLSGCFWNQKSVVRIKSSAQFCKVSRVGISSTKDPYLEFSYQPFFKGSKFQWNFCWPNMWVHLLNKTFFINYIYLIISFPILLASNLNMICLQSSNSLFFPDYMRLLNKT